MMRWLALSAFAFGLVACATSPDAPASSASFLANDEIGVCEELDEEAVEHACLHGTAGPFRSVTASTAAPPDVSRAHTAYKVQLQPLSSGQFGGALSFVPPETGDYMIYTSADAPSLELVQGGKAIAFECSAAVSEICAALPRLRVVELEAGVPVVIGLEPTQASRVVLLIEHGGHGHEH